MSNRPINGLLLASGMSDGQLAVMYRLLADRLRMNYQITEAELSVTEKKLGLKFPRIPIRRHHTPEGVSCIGYYQGKCTDPSHWTQADGPYRMLRHIAETIEFMDSAAETLIELDAGKTT